MDFLGQSGCAQPMEARLTKIKFKVISPLNTKNHLCLLTQKEKFFFI